MDDRITARDEGDEATDRNKTLALRAVSLLAGRAGDDCVASPDGSVRLAVIDDPPLVLVVSATTAGLRIDIASRHRFDSTERDRLVRCINEWTAMHRWPHMYVVDDERGCGVAVDSRWFTSPGTSIEDTAAFMKLQLDAARAFLAAVTHDDRDCA